MFYTDEFDTTYSSQNNLFNVLMSMPIVDHKEVKRFDLKSPKSKTDHTGHMIAPYYRKEWKREQKGH